MDDAGGQSAVVLKTYWSYSGAVVLLVKTVFWQSSVPDSGRHEKQQSVQWA